MTHADAFAQPVSRWEDIPGWFGWRRAQEEAVEHFGDGVRFLEVGTYLGRSLCSLAEVVQRSGRRIGIVGVDTCRGSGPEGPRQVNAHGPAVEYGGGTFAGLLHRNVLACGFADLVTLLITDSLSAATMFDDGALAWVHIDARHDYDSVRADIAAWAPKVAAGGWLSGDDYNPSLWPGVVGAVGDALPDASEWTPGQWRWIKPSD
ncbi:class I SAM-dependent methyltransferase [Mycobacterium sp. PS03-16]|uniref:class I SAM-dependent methyltransferase n=1 Tax=Mycobacterium sp. PS03-16 TaxID=2559611 RepID=UPI001073AFF6|nr:class I SAM-dependent methyltransferase [Mycobacterium sp. PS03-16]TFV55876.1 class I SAM-dependent methyltransferase [Mycobacterium sp. PS03-16]